MIEIEKKFRFEVEPEEIRQTFFSELPVQWKDEIIQKDTYYDTPDFNFFRAGVAIRIRASESGNQLTLKTLEGVISGLAIRSEFTQSVEPGGPNWQTDSGEVLDLCKPLLTKSIDMHPIITLETRRIAGILELNDEISVEISLDRVNVNSTSFSEMEIELISGKKMILTHSAVNLIQIF